MEDSRRKKKRGGGSKEKNKVKIVPWSNIDCLCVMLLPPIWASHICGGLLLHIQDEILGSVSVNMCVCGPQREARAALFLRLKREATGRSPISNGINRENDFCGFIF